MSVNGMEAMRQAGSEIRLILPITVGLLWPNFWWGPIIESSQLQTFPVYADDLNTKSQMTPTPPIAQ